MSHILHTIYHLPLLWSFGPLRTLAAPSQRWLGPRGQQVKVAEEPAAPPADLDVGECKHAKSHPGSKLPIKGISLGLYRVLMNGLLVLGCI